MGKQAEDKDWGAPAETNFEDAVRYKAREGYSDIIQVISNCKSTPRHWTGNKYPHMAFYLRCMEEENAECCKEFGGSSASNTAFVLHVAQRKGEGEWKLVGEAKVWGFCEDVRKQKLGVIIRDFCGSDIKKFKKTKLIITCSDEQFQKISIIPYNGEEIKITDEMKKSVQDNKQMFIDDITIDREDILKSLQRLRGEESSDDKGSAPAEDIGELDIDTELDDLVKESDGDDNEVPF